MPVADEAPEADLRDYLRVIQRRKGLIILSVLVVVVTTLAASYAQTKVYRGTAQILLEPKAQETLFDPNTGQANTATATQVQTDIQVITSRPVKDAVTKQLGRAPKVSVSQVGQTDIVNVSADSTDPAQAAAVANAYANSFIDFRRTQDINGLTAAATQLQTQIDALQKQVDTDNAQIAGGNTALTGQRDALISQQSVFKSKLDQLTVDSSLKSGGAQLTTPAVVPTSPVKPTPKRNAIIALAVGLIFGTGLAFLFEYLDDSIRSKEDLDRASEGTPNLGLIPPVKPTPGDEAPTLISIVEPNSPAAEAYRTLRTSVQFLGMDKPLRSLLVTSSSAAEGKSTTVANLGVALARAGQWVCVVDCDLRRPRLHDFFDVSNEVGFTSTVLGETPLAEALQGVDGLDRLAVLATGPLPPNPAELLSSARATEIIEALTRQFDVVIFDSPPVLPVTDAVALSTRMDAMLLVATAGTTSRREVTRAVELLAQVNAPLSGTVLNGVSSTGHYGYGKGHYYRYHGPEYAPHAAAAHPTPEANLRR